MSGGAGSPGPSPDIEQVIKDARRQGYEVIRSDPRHLLLDLDSDSAVAQYGSILPVVDQTYGATEVERWKSKSGRLHVKVRLQRPVSILTRLGLQAMLGSDAMREALSLKRAKEGQSEPSVLFRPK